MFLKCFKELLESPKLLQMTHLTTVPLKHQATGHQGSAFPEQDRLLPDPLMSYSGESQSGAKHVARKERQQQRESPIELEPFASSCGRPALSSVWIPH